MLDGVAAAAKAGPVAVEALPTTRIAPTLMAPEIAQAIAAAAAHHGEATLAIHKCAAMTRWWSGDSSRPP